MTVDWSDVNLLRLAEFQFGREFLKRRTVRVELFREYGSEEWTLTAFKAIVDKAYAAARSAEAKLGCPVTDMVEMDYDSDHAELTLFYERPESEQEYQQRIYEANAWAAKELEFQKTRKRSLYAQLKAEFEP